MYYMYVIRSSVDRKLYIGFTNDLKRRLAEHNTNQSHSTRYRGPFDLIYYEAYKARIDARDREKKLKQFKNSYRELNKRISASLDT
jgi:putative endonuclease